MACAWNSHEPLPEYFGPLTSGIARGAVQLPGSKSLTQRYFNLALLCGQTLRIHRPAIAEDTELYAAALAKLAFELDEKPEWIDLHPRKTSSPAGSSAAPVRIDCGAGGTMFRFLTASLCTLPGDFELDGIPRLRERPIAPLVDALRALGAEIRYAGREGFAPLWIRGGSLVGGTTRLDAGTSSQFLSALLMAALAAPQPTTIELAALTSEPYVDLTLDAIADFGGRVTRQADTFVVEPRRATSDGVDAVWIEPDFSAVGYPAGAALLTGGEVLLHRVRRESRQGDRHFVDLLGAMGGEITWLDGKSGGLRVQGRADRHLRALDVDLEAMPDQVPTLAALAPFAHGVTQIRNVPNLRVKESDRLSAMATELRKVGVPVEELPDGLIVPGVFADQDPPSNPVTIETWGDHRIAMAMALVGLRRPGLTFHHPQVVAKSYPRFWHDLGRLLGDPS